MWVDKLEIGDVTVVRSCTSPATPDEFEMSFPDGSILCLRVDVDIPEECTTEAAAAEHADTTAAAKLYSAVVSMLFAMSNKAFLDTDFPPGRHDVKAKQDGVEVAF